MPQRDEDFPEPGLGHLLDSGANPLPIAQVIRAGRSLIPIKEVKLLSAGIKGIGLAAYGVSGRARITLGVWSKVGVYKSAEAPEAMTGHVRHNV
jgi:hypothetical protein